VAGVIKGPNGSYVLGPNSRVIRAGEPTVVVAPRTLAPGSVTLSTSATAGTEITPLVFSGFPDDGLAPFTSEYTNEFAGVSHVVTLVSNAGGRVALAGDWVQGYRLVVGPTVLAAGSYAVVLQVSGFPETFTIAVTIEAVIVVDPGDPDPPDPPPPTSTLTLFTATVENFDTVASWTDQEMSIGQWFKPGDVPVGTIAVLSVDGIRIPQQVSNRTTWSDGSLKLAQVRFLMPTIAAGQTKTVTWQRTPGTWTATDTPLHTSPTAITAKVALEYAFSSFKGRTSANVLTAERGPKRFRSADLLGTGNSAWIERILGGPVCSEWRASDMATLSTGAKDADLGCLLYARAWGGTAGNPKRIQFLYRSVYGWSTDVAADAQGFRADLNLSVNGTVIRGAALGTVGWGAVNGWKGGFFTSAGTEGKMDWFDVATNAFVTPPKIIYRHNIPYGVTAKFVPPYDTSNPAFPMTPAVQTYLPGRRGPLRPIQDDIADHAMLCWTTAKPMAWCIAAHARATAQQLSDHQRLARSAGWGMGAMTSVALHRTTRKIVCYLPPTKSTNLSVLGTGVYGTGKPAEAPQSLRWANGATAAEIANLDASHFPQMAFWPYISEGDQHWLDLMYHEATLPGAFETGPYGFFGTSDRAKIPYGGIVFKGQVRAVGHTIRPIGNAVGAGNPSDPHWVMCRDMIDHWAEMTEELPLEEDAWRGGLSRTDGRRFQDLKLLWPNNEPTYKIWMHTFGLHSTSYAYGISEYPRLKSRAEWWAHCPTVMGGGWHNDDDYLMKPDPIEAGNYLQIAMSSGAVGMVGTSTIEDRRYWFYGQWKSATSVTTYKADGKTLSWTGPMQGTTGMADGMIITITGIRESGEPLGVIDMTKIPAGLTRNIPYYAVQSSGNTCKIALSPGGAPVTFTTGGVDLVGACVRTTVGGLHTQNTGAFVSVDANNYIVQVGAALAVYQHYVAPTDARVRLARQKIFNLKNTSPAPNQYDERGKMTVPLTAVVTPPPPPPPPTGTVRFDSATVKFDSSSLTFDKG
jgi:hypothetical protein